MPFTSISSFCTSFCSFVLGLSEPGPSRLIPHNFQSLLGSPLSADSIIMFVTSPPGPPPFLPPKDCDMVPLSSSLPEAPHYNLRPLATRARKGFVVGGLSSDPNPFGPRKARGRNSELSKAQLKAKIDIADGKQKSLFGVLRVALPPNPGLR